MDPRLCFELFLEAVRARDQGRAERASTRAGWGADGDTARRWFEQATSVGLDARQGGAERVHHDRAAIPAVVSGGATPADVWFLLRRDGDAWRVEGTAAGWSVAGQWLMGRIDGAPTFSSLPTSEAAARWAEGVVADPKGAGGAADPLVAELFSEARRVELRRTVEAPGSGRAGALLSVEQSDGSVQQVWVVLGASGATVRPVGRSYVGSLGALLRGVELKWPFETDDGPKSWSEDEARALLQSAVGDALAARGDAGLAPKMGALLTELFDQGLAGPDPAEAPPTEGAAERRVKDELARALADFVAKARPPGTPADAPIDSAFVQQHGGALATTLVGAFAQALVPPELSAPGAGGVRVDVADLLRGLFRPPAPR